MIPLPYSKHQELRNHLISLDTRSIRDQAWVTSISVQAIGIMNKQGLSTHSTIF